MLYFSHCRKRNIELLVRVQLYIFLVVSEAQINREYTSET